MKKLLIFLSALALLAQPVFAASPSKEKDEGGDRIPGQYIVVFKDSVANPDVTSDEISTSEGLGKLHSYKNVIKGFAATIPDAKLKKIQDDPRVAFISQDRTVSIFDRPEIA